MIRENLSTRLSLLRKEAGISQEELGKAIGLKQFTISDIERGKNLTSVETLAAFAEYFHTSADYLLGLTDIRERQQPEMTDITSIEKDALAQ